MRFMKGLPGSDVELVCKTLQVEQKLFYFDVKENPRGRYLKISEKTSGSRSTIIVPLSGVVWFVNLVNYYATGDDPDLSGEEVQLESKELQLDTKVFYFDIGENQRGRFLKVSEASVTHNRSTIIVPAGNTAGEGWAAFRDTLAEIDGAQHLLPPTDNLFELQKPSGLSEQLGGLSVTVSTGYLPGYSNLQVTTDDAGGMDAARVMQAEQKKIFFDLGSNSRGQYLRISEVAGADRSAIILPASALDQFHETLGHFVELVRGQGLTGTSVANARSVAPLRKRIDS